VAALPARNKVVRLPVKYASKVSRMQATDRISVVSWVRVMRKPGQNTIASGVKTGRTNREVRRTEDAAMAAKPSRFTPTIAAAAKGF
jgi:hypothetical protein